MEPPGEPQIEARAGPQREPEVRARLRGTGAGELGPHPADLGRQARASASATTELCAAEQARGTELDDAILVVDSGRAAADPVGARERDAEPASLERDVKAHEAGSLRDPAERTADGEAGERLDAGSVALREFYYQHSKTVVNPATYIPFVGSFLGNSDTDFQKLTIIFDENDVVEHFLYDETSQETKTPLGF